MLFNSSICSCSFLYIYHNYQGSLLPQPLITPTPTSGFVEGVLMTCVMNRSWQVFSFLTQTLLARLILPGFGLGAVSDLDR